MNRGTMDIFIHKMYGVWSVSTGGMVESWEIHTVSFTRRCHITFHKDCSNLSSLRQHIGILPTLGIDRLPQFC